MKIRKILSGALAFTITAVALPHLPVLAAESDWHTLYKDKLYEFMESEDYTKNAAFELCDLSYDDIPELIISEGESHDDQCRIYTFSPYSGEFIDLGKLGTYGTIGYCSDGNSAILSRDISEDYEQGVFYHLKNRNNFTKILSYYSGKIGGVDKTVYKLNDNTVSERRYQLAIQEYSIDEFKWLGRANDFSNEAIKSVLTEEWRGIYAETLHSIRESENYSDDFMFDLYDADGDGIPELFISELFGKRCSVYTMYDGKMICVGEYRSAYAKAFPDNDMLLLSSYYDGHYIDKYYAPENGILNNVIIFETICGKTSTVFKIDDEVMSKEEYSEKLKQYSDMTNSIYLGRKYDLGEYSVEYALNPPEVNLTDIQKKLYIQTLYLFEASCIYNTYQSKFDLCDLDGNGTPELIISPSAGGACRIFTVNGDELIDLGEYGAQGALCFDIEKQLIYFNGDYCHACRSEYWKLSGNKILSVFSCVDRSVFSDSQEYHIYTVNGKETTKEKFGSALADYGYADLNNSFYIGQRYSLEISDVASALYANGEKASPLTQMKLAGMAFKAVSGFTMEGQS